MRHRILAQALVAFALSFGCSGKSEDADSRGGTASEAQTAPGGGNQEALTHSYGRAILAGRVRVVGTVPPPVGSWAWTRSRSRA